MIGRLVVGAVFVSLAGCGDHVSKREADKGWRSTQVAMGQAGIITGGSISGAVTAGNASGTVDGVVACPDGGTIEVSAAGNVDDESVTASLHVEFDGCKADGIVTDGVLDYEAYVSAERISASYAGELTWSGRAKGSCVIEASAEVTTGNVSVKLKGDICGYDWADLG